MFKYKLSVFIIYSASFASLIIPVSAFALEIITPVPADRADTVMPREYAECYMIKAGAYMGIWNSGHRVCRYNSPDHEMLVAGYWQCSRYTPSKKICTGWTWVPAHWSKTEDVQLIPDATSRSGWHTKW